MIRKIDALISEQIRPSLRSHGGNIELIDFDNNKLFVKLTGGCQGCSSSVATLRDGVAKVVQQKFPEVEEIIDLTDHDAGKNPYM